MWWLEPTCVLVRPGEEKAMGEWERNEMLFLRLQSSAALGCVMAGAVLGVDFVQGGSRTSR